MHHSAELQSNIPELFLSEPPDPPGVELLGVEPPSFGSLGLYAICENVCKEETDALVVMLLIQY